MSIAKVKDNLLAISC